MRLDERASLLVTPLDVCLEFPGLDSPLPAATDLYRRQLPGTHECANLGSRHAKHVSNFGERQAPLVHTGQPGLSEAASGGPDDALRTSVAPRGRPPGP